MTSRLAKYGYTHSKPPSAKFKYIQAKEPFQPTFSHVTAEAREYVAETEKLNYEQHILPETKKKNLFLENSQKLKSSYDEADRLPELFQTKLIPSFKAAYSFQGREGELMHQKFPQWSTQSLRANQIHELQARLRAVLMFPVASEDAEGMTVSEEEREERTYLLSAEDSHQSPKSNRGETDDATTNPSSIEEGQDEPSSPQDLLPAPEEVVVLESFEHKCELALERFEDILTANVPISESTCFQLIKLLSETGRRKLFETEKEEQDHHRLYQSHQQSPSSKDDEAEEEENPDDDEVGKEEGDKNTSSSPSSFPESTRSLQGRREEEGGSFGMSMGEQAAAYPHLQSSSMATTSSESEVPFLDQIMYIYRYMRQFFIAPKRKTVECVLKTLRRVDTPSERVMHLASCVYLNANKDCILVSPATVACYIDICGINGEMELATGAFTTATLRWHIKLNADICRAMLTGYTRNGMLEESVRFIARLKEVKLTCELFNSVLETLLLSEDGHSVFSAYVSAFGDGGGIGHGASSIFQSFSNPHFQPNAHTFTILLYACEKTGAWELTRPILMELTKRKIHGDEPCLNLLLKGFLTLKWTPYARQLYLNMKEKNVPVWKALENALPKGVQKHGAGLVQSEKVKEKIFEEVKEEGKQKWQEEVGEQRALEDGEGLPHHHHRKELFFSEEKKPMMHSGEAMEQQLHEPKSAGEGPREERSQEGKRKKLHALFPHPSTKSIIPRTAEGLKKFAAAGHLDKIDVLYLETFLRNLAVKIPRYIKPWKKCKTVAERHNTKRQVIALTHQRLFGVKSAPYIGNTLIPNQNKKKQFGNRKWGSTSDRLMHQVRMGNFEGSSHEGRGGKRGPLKWKSKYVSAENITL